MPGVYLFSVDLEDVRTMIPDGMKFKEAVPRCTKLYLNWLDEIKSKATFFVVGETALAYPQLLKEIHERGHELACHTFSHLHLTAHTPETFEIDLIKNKEAIQNIVDVELKGFRAPTYSLIKNTSWAYAILKNLGFTYSSSVLPAKNPLFGWRDFGNAKWMQGVYELPISISPFMNLPFGGGVYFRVLPTFLMKQWFKNPYKYNKDVIGYFHPYDIDVEQEPFMHPHLHNNFFYNKLMYFNRSKVFDRLNTITQQGFKVMRYDTYLKQKGIL